MAWQKSVVALAAAVVLPLTGVMAGSSVAAAPALPVGSSAAVNGQLKVCGVKLCNQAGQQVQLRGMSTHGIQWYSQCVKTASLDALATDWKADVLRISMYIQEGGYESNPRKFTDMVHGYIEEATKRGMYALVDDLLLAAGGGLIGGAISGITSAIEGESGTVIAMRTAAGFISGALFAWLAEYVTPWISGALAGAIQGALDKLIDYYKDADERGCSLSSLDWKKVLEDTIKAAIQGAILGGIFAGLGPKAMKGATALMNKIPYYTTVSGARAAVEGIAAMREGTLDAAPLQSYFNASF